MFKNCLIIRSFIVILKKNLDILFPRQYLGHIKDESGGRIFFLSTTLARSDAKLNFKILSVDVAFDQI